MARVPGAKGQPWYRHGYVWLVIAVPMSSVIVGIIMFTLATRSYDGLVADDYYKRGLQINQRLDRDKAAQAVGLAAELELTGDELRIRLRAKQEPFRAPRTLRVRFSHATRAGLDRSVTVAEHAPGEYRGRAQRLDQGRWYVEISAGSWRLTDVLMSQQTRVVLEAGAS